MELCGIPRELFTFLDEMHLLAGERPWQIELCGPGTNRAEKLLVQELVL